MTMYFPSKINKLKKVTGKNFISLHLFTHISYSIFCRSSSQDTITTSCIIMSTSRNIT